MFSYVNLTPHALNVLDVYGNTTFIPASGNVARVEERVSNAGISAVGEDFGVSEIHYVGVVGLPEPGEGTIYIVSQPTALFCSERRDVWYPGDAIRDEAGRVIGCRGFKTLAPMKIFSADEFKGLVEKADQACHADGGLAGCVREIFFPDQPRREEEYVREVISFPESGK